jgi:D-glycero-D-manno-heptose 1,7-bisphosphate phosphatase
VFLDRDGTMIRDMSYLSRVDEIDWYPWTLDAIRLLNRAGFYVFVTTNQGGVGLGLYEEGAIGKVHDAMSVRIAEGGGRIDGWFYCPHHPRAVIESLRRDCDCRKPKPGMIHQAQAKFDLDLARSFVVGDKMADVGLAQAVGARGILVKTGHGAGEMDRHHGTAPGAALVADTLMEAVSWILAARHGA